MPWPASTVVERGVSPFRRDERRASNVQWAPSLPGHKVVISHGPVSASEAAGNRKDLIELQREFSVLSKQYQKQEGKMQEVLHEVRHTRAERDARDKELNTLRRTVDRLQSERDALDAAAQSDKAYIRRLETRLQASDPEKASATRKKNSELSEEAGSLRNRISALEEANKAYQSEISVLQRALEIRASELSGEGGPEVPSRLLYAVAKGREEGVAIAVQLAERTGALRRAEDTAADARDQLAAVRVAEEQASRTVRQLTEALSASRQEAAEARNQAAEAASRAEEAAEAAQRAAQALEDERRRSSGMAQTMLESERGHDETAQALRQEVEAERLRGLQAVEETQREWQDRMMEMQEYLGQAQEEVESVRRIAGAQVDAATAAWREESDRAANAETAASEAIYREESLREEAGALHAQLESLVQVNDRLQGEVHDAREELRRAEQRAGSLGSQLETVEREKSNERAERGETESSLRQRAEGALRQLNEAIAEREAAKLAAAEAQGAAQQAMSAQDRAERDAAALKDVADALAQSKGALQRTMVEQLGALRAQLERSQSQNQQLERLLLERRAAAATTAAAAQDAANANAALLHVQAIETQVTGFGGGGVGSSSGGGGGNLYVRQDMSADPPLPSYSKFYNPPAALSGYGGGGGFGGGLSGVGGVGGVSSSAAAAAVSTQMEVRVQQQEQARHQIERHLRNQELLQRRAPASPAGAGGGAGASMPPRPPSPRVDNSWGASPIKGASTSMLGGGGGGGALGRVPSAALEAAAAATGAGSRSLLAGRGALGSSGGGGAAAGQYHGSTRGPTLAEIAAGLDGFESPRDD